MNFLQRLLGRAQPTGSAEIAKERLKVVLVSDRTNITPALLETLKDEIVAGISKHVEIDREGMQVTVTQGRDYNRIVADIPVLRTRSAVERKNVKRKT